MSAVTYEKYHDCVILRINREHKRNAVNEEVIDKLNTFITKAAEDEEAAVVVITGSGAKAFCSGGDLEVFGSLYTADEAYPVLKKMSEVLLKLFFFSKPTVAMINGHAVGGGSEIASACDFRFAVPEAKLGFIQGRLGITTGWGGSSFLFQQFGRRSLPLLTSAKVYRAQELESIGFIDKVFKTSGEDLMTQVVNELHTNFIMDRPVLEAYKRRKLDQINRKQLEANVEREVTDCAVLWEREEHHQAVENFFNK
ncbi:enoyl-CoA hydratase/carnithine racemase [Salsuginibacillus halophilus]|uniref:Ethylmalonyl-CoA decarboxylase n=1 Tax=Salsuginibacillus halophilus TaxID=517424 RepID=A0A2P8HX15_9BACI|nr:enoyl-CoA hydratase/isomerase family protein [Salsuginibacillus halophilus]PSL50783.1 enoyl-CoA hydratase/carnithine racemase [Salsuginibacillus halophilus]